MPESAALKPRWTIVHPGTSRVRTFASFARTLSLLALVVLGMLAQPGCAGRSAANAKGPALDYLALYSSGQYEAAYNASSEIASSMRSADKHRASLIAGLSAHALDRHADAKKWLSPLTNDADPAISGKACAAMGLVAQDENRHAEAATLLQKASERLQGDDAARSAMYAGDSFRALNKPAEARAMYQRAHQAARDDAGLRVLVGDRLTALSAQETLAKARTPSTLGAATSKQITPKPPTTSVPSSKGVAIHQPLAKAEQKSRASLLSRPPSRSSTYSVQTGTFVSWNSAISAMGTARKHGKARVIEMRDAFGRRLYSVRVGIFASPGEAERLRDRVGGEAIVVPSENG